ADGRPADTTRSPHPRDLLAVFDGVVAAAERFRGEHEQHGPARGGAGAVHLAAARQGAVREEAFAASHHDGEDQQLVFVDHPGLAEGGGELGAAADLTLPLPLRLQPRDSAQRYRAIALGGHALVTILSGVLAAD